MKKLIGMVLSLCFAASAFAVVITDVRVENLGTAPLDAALVEGYTSITPGYEVEAEEQLQAAVAHDVANLRRSGRFAYVKAVLEKAGEELALIYQVKGRRRLRSINITGAERVNNRKVGKELGLELGQYVDDAVVGSRVRKVEQYYLEHNFPSANVTWELIPEPGVAAADLVLKVDEGGKVSVKKIRFEGGRFKDASLFSWLPDLFPSRGEYSKVEANALRNVLQQKETWWITPWFGRYKPEAVDADLAAIRRFYQNLGFLDVEVSGPELVPLRRGQLQLTYRINEGPQYHIGSAVLTGVSIFEPADVEGQIRLQAGAIASKVDIDAAAAAAGRYYGNRGYIRSYVSTDLETDPETALANVRFEMHEGELAHINRINIRGNEKTRDVVMRREIVVYPKEVFHQQKVETSEHRLQNLGYFDFVRSQYAPAETEGEYDLTFNVKEKSMGSFMVGAGFSSVDSIVGFAELSHGNFDVKSWPPIGDGQKLKLRLQLGSERNDLEFSFVEPWFLDRKLSFGVDIYRRNAGFYSDEYDLTTTGARLTLGKPLTPFIRGSVSYSLEQFELIGVDTNAPAFIQAEAMSRIKSAVSASVSRDTRDNFYYPTRGNITSIGTQYAGGPLAGDTATYGFNMRSSHFWPVWKDHVFNLKGAAEVVESHGEDMVPIFDRLFLGGPRTIRAFAYRNVGPQEDDEPTGGNSSWYMTAEYTVPLWEKVRMAGFYDMGAVSEAAYDFKLSEYSSGYGFGLIFQMPMFPLRIDYAWPLMTDDFNEDAQGRWNFQLGYTF